MKTELKQYTVREVTEGFVYNEFEGKGLYGLSGQLVIQPEYQRNYIYGDGKKDVAEARGVSNCPLCAVGANANKTKIYTMKEMDADHVTAWSKGGATDESNCEMLCITHNRAKGNR